MLRKQTARLKNIISNEHGYSTLVWGIAFMIFALLIFCIFFENYRVYMVSGEVSRDITNTLTSTASAHLYDSYSTIRDGTSGAYLYDGSSYREIKDTSKFTALFVSIYKETTASGSTITKKADGRKVFTISDIRLYVENAGSSTVKSTYMCEYTLIIYQDLLWKGDTIILDNQRQIVRYKNKF